MDSSIDCFVSAGNTTGQDDVELTPVLSTDNDIQELIAPDFFVVGKNLISAAQDEDAGREIVGLSEAGKSGEKQCPTEQQCPTIVQTEQKHDVVPGPGSKTTTVLGLPLKSMATPGKVFKQRRPPSKSCVKSPMPRQQKYCSKMIAELLMQKIQQEETEAVVLSEKISVFANDHAHEIQSLQNVITNREQDIERLSKGKVELEKQIAASAARTRKLKLNANKMIAFLNDMSSDHADLRKQADEMKGNLTSLIGYARENKRATEANVESFTALEGELTVRKEMLHRAAEQDKVLNDELSRMAGRLAEAHHSAPAEKRYDELHGKVLSLMEQISAQRSYFETKLAASTDVIVAAQRRETSQSLAGIYDSNLELGAALQDVQERIKQSQSRSVEVS